MKRFVFYLILLGILPFVSFSQSAQWKFTYLPSQNSSTNEFEIVIDITIPNDFHMYSFDQAPGGPIPAMVSFTTPQGIEKIGGLQYKTQEPKEFYDDIFGINIRQISGHTTWSQKFRVTHSIVSEKITGKYSYQLCKDDGFCINPLPEQFSVPIKDFLIEKETVLPSKETTKGTTTTSKIVASSTQIRHQDTSITNAQIDTTSQIQATQESTTKTHGRSLWLTFFLGFLGGLLAFLTPCVFPMVPMTVSMFLKRDKQHALRDIIIYGLSIVFIFVALGLSITLLFGVDALNKLSTEPTFNMVFFIIFVLFAVSFFGVFELMLPTSWINYFDKKADSSKGFFSIFFMAFTLVLVSFSCTAMIIGTLLVESVVTGTIAGPLVGMLGFAIALALPFIIFAAVPSLLQSLAKSGEWMNDIKVFLGFIELGFALKFISKADLVAGWEILPRDVFIAIWIVLLIIWGFYILRIFPRNRAIPLKINKTRITIAALLFCFALYLIPGFLGKPLDLVSGYLPPMSTQKIHILSAEDKLTDVQKQKKYSNLFHSPYGIEGFYDYDEGLAYAKQTNKPILLDFTGLGCENCRKIEMNVWEKPEILSLLKNDYVLISLYLDSREPLDSSLVRKETYGEKTYDITTLGEHWSIFMMKNYHGLMQPYYVILSPEGKQIGEPITYNEAKDVAQFKAFLEKGIEYQTKQ